MLKNFYLEEIADIYNILESIKKEYKKNIKDILITNHFLNIKNNHIIPSIKKIQINRGLGLNAQNKKILKESINDFKMITGQTPIFTKTKKAISGFKTRRNMVIGLTVTLRSKKMYSFLTKLILFTFSQIRNFHGLSLRSFDKAGNFTFGLKEQLIFPEINYNDNQNTQGFTITIVLNQKLPKNKKIPIFLILNSVLLFKFLRFPLRDFGYYEDYPSFIEIKQIWRQKRNLKRKRWSQE
uniref:50S ribosomal protein L5, chloroplastic n=1 Tax=Nitzschia sp. NIES-3576 TaxID=2083273 RepID=A0A2Z5ZAI9_9STRA|nr:ribosomal protein L5 [Nitzschia sp. NIES-3576]